MKKVTEPDIYPRSYRAANDSIFAVFDEAKKMEGEIATCESLIREYLGMPKHMLRDLNECVNALISFSEKAVSHIPLNPPKE